MQIEIQEYVAADGRCPFTHWLAGIRDVGSKARILKRLARVRIGLLGDWKAVREGVVELREDFGPGYRTYAGRHADSLIVLLAGGVKRTQRKDIEHEIRNWKDWRERHARASP